MNWRVSEPAAIASCAVLGMILLAAKPPLAGPTPAYTWRLNNWAGGPGRVHLELTRLSWGSRWVDGRDYDLSDLTGLTRDQLGAIHAKVRFGLERDAGTIVCSGVLMGGVGGGEFGFSPSGTFVAEMRKLGYDNLDSEHLLSMALSDVSLGFARRIAETGLRDITVDQLIRLRQRNITAEFIAEIRATGYDCSMDELIRLKDHGIDTRYLRELKSSGYDLRADEIIRLHDHGVSSEYLHNLAFGKYDFSAGEIAQLHDHGVSHEFLTEVKRAGYDLNSAQLIRLHDHGVDAAYMRRLKESTYSFAADDIVRLKDNGVPSEFPKQLNASGYNDVTAGQMIRMWQNGVNGGYVAHLAASGMKQLSPEQMIRLKQHGVD